jgi:hypothetical protein
VYGISNIGNENFRIRGVKFYGDGGAGSRSATVSVRFEPIPADPLGDRNYGSLVEPDSARRLEQFRTAAVEYGWELHTHSIGDVALRQTTDAYMKVIDEIRAEDPAADLRSGLLPLRPAHQPLWREPRLSQWDVHKVVGLSSTDLAESMGSGRSTGGKRARLQSGVVVGELALASGRRPLVL